MATNETLKALVEIRKTLTDLQITMTDHWVYEMAMGEAFSRFDGRFGAIFEECLQVEKNKQFAGRQSLQTISDTLKKVIQTLEPLQGPVN